MDLIRGVTGLDHYERAARLYPSLLAVAPVSATIFLWAPDASALLRGGIGVAATAALTLLLMRYGRAKGRAVQERMVLREGGLASTVALRHRDRAISKASKMRYHAMLRTHGLEIPDGVQEAADPVAADDCYRSAADWLRGQTRDPKKFALLHAENRDYGFRRNLLGLKPLGLMLTLLALSSDVSLLLTQTESGTQRMAALILAAALAAASLAWTFIVTVEFVADASRSYTEQLLACCDVLAKPPAAPKKAKKDKAKPDA